MIETLWVHPDRLRPNPWNPNVMDAEMYQKAIASIQEFGFVDPITVRNGDEFYEIIDGENRWRAAGDLGLESIPVFNLGQIDTQVAQKLTIVLNETRGNPDPGKLGALLKRLAVKESREQLLRVLPFSNQMFEGLTEMPTLRWDERPKLTSDRPKGAGWVERTYRMPVEAAEVVDQALARVRADEPEMADWQALEAIAADFLA